MVRCPHTFGHKVYFILNCFTNASPTIISTAVICLLTHVMLEVKVHEFELNVDSRQLITVVIMYTFWNLYYYKMTKNISERLVIGLLH